MYERDARVAAGAPVMGSLSELRDQTMPKCEPPLFRSFDDLVRVQSRAIERLDALSTRLEPLLSPAVAENSANGTVSRPSASHFDGMLLGRVEIEQLLVDRIESLLNRLSI